MTTPWPGSPKYAVGDQVVWIENHPTKGSTRFRGCILDVFPFVGRVAQRRLYFYDVRCNSTAQIFAGVPEMQLALHSVLDEIVEALSA